MVWLTIESVAAAGGMTPPAVGTPDHMALTMAVAATEAYVSRRRPDIDEGAVPADVLLGGAMLAQRYYQRRNSPLGTVGSPDMGLTAILRTDPDICDLLGIGRGAGFAFSSGSRP